MVIFNKKRRAVTLYANDRTNPADKEYEQTLNRLATIGQISAGIAHEIRNPLTAAKGFLQLLQKEYSHKYLDMASAELERAILILHDMLQVAKPPQDDEPYVPVSLSSDLEAVLALFQDQLYRVQVVKRFSHTDQHIYGQRNQLKKAFFNLIKNAIESIPENGTITLEHVRIDDRIRISIADTGTGIPEDKIVLLGTPFFSMKSEGTGLGLTLVQSVLNQHGAVMDVVSEEGKGTTFTLYFPIERRKTS
jgi:signal transduction histidine kinase